MLAHRTSSDYSQIAMEQIPFLTNGLLLGIFGIALGIVVSESTESLYTYIEKMNKFIVSGLWIIALAYFVYITAFLKRDYELLYYLVAFLALLVLSLQEGALSRLFSNKIFEVFCRSSYAIYMMQFPCFYYLKKMMVKEDGWTGDPFSMVIFGVSLCIIVGLATHLLIEIPAGKWLDKRMKKFFGAKKEG